MMKPKIYVLLGDGGLLSRVGSWLFSSGFAAWAASLKDQGYDTETWSSPLDLKGLIAEIRALPKGTPIIVLGYSLGANGCAWLAYYLRPYSDVIIDLIVGFDPTVNGPALSNYAIGPNVKRCICFHQTSYIGTSMFFGRGVYVSGNGGPKIEVYDTVSDHLAVQFNPRLKDIAVAAIKAVA